MEDVENSFDLSQATRMHLGEVLYKKYKPILEKRILYQKGYLAQCKMLVKSGQMSALMFGQLKGDGKSLKKVYRRLNPEDLRVKYFVHGTI